MMLLLALMMALAAPGRPAAAQEAKPETTAAQAELTMQEFQGLSCLTFGAGAALGSLAYAELLATATAGVTAPLLVPVMATAFVAGCGVGAVLSPGLLWIYRRVEPHF